MWIASTKHGSERTLRHGCSERHAWVTSIRLRWLRICSWRRLSRRSFRLLLLSRRSITYLDALLTLGLLIPFSRIPIALLRLSRLLVAGALIALLGCAALIRLLIFLLALGRGLLVILLVFLLYRTLVRAMLTYSSCSSLTFLILFILNLNSKSE